MARRLVRKREMLPRDLRGLCRRIVAAVLDAKSARAERAYAIWPGKASA
jgi:hypothetical protein